ncbi:MAG: 50S ribosomal protein L10 [Solirubrobacteraceae bacterium]
MNRDQKAAVIDEVAAQISGSEAVFAVDYRGISVPQAAELRTRLRDADASFRIVKNTLTLRAADKAGADGLKELLEGPTAMTFVRGDAATAAKALADFRRASGGVLLEFKGGWMNGAPLDATQIDAIARLPSRDVLNGRLVGMVASPLTGLVTSLSGLIGGLARQLQAMADQGLVGGAAESRPDTDTGPTESPEDPGPEPDPDPGESPAEETPTETQEDN